MGTLLNLETLNEVNKYIITCFPFPFFLLFSKISYHEDNIFPLQILDYSINYYFFVFTRVSLHVFKE